jgi:leader peptidase (prepilin peptidase)/N-methyltransferase
VDSGPIWLGILLGLVAGLAVVWIARRLTGDAPPPPVPGPDEGREGAGPGIRPLLLGALVPAGMAAWGGYAGFRSEALAQLVSAVIVTALLLSIALIDFKSRRIPDVLLFGLLAWVLVQMAWLWRPSPGAAIAGLLAGGGLFLGIALLRRGAMGAGDVKLAAGLGALLGLPLILPGLLIGALAGGLAALALLVTGRAGRKDPMAYGPYLALGAWLVWTAAMGMWF